MGLLPGDSRRAGADGGCTVGVAGGGGDRPEHRLYRQHHLRRAEPLEDPDKRAWDQQATRNGRR